MNTLRIVLGIAGIILILGIYFYQSKKRLLTKSPRSTTHLIKQIISTYSNAMIEFFMPFKHALMRLFQFARKKEPTHLRQRPSEALSHEQLHNMSDIVTSASSRNSNQLKSSESKLKIFSNEKKGTAFHETKSDSMQKLDAKSDNDNLLLVSLTVLPKIGTVFVGNDILNACKIAGLQLGEYNIFHRYAIVDEKVLMTPVCSLVNLFEPGYFEFTAMDDFSTQGLSLFMQLPGPVDGRDAFIILMDIADKLSTHLNATICDETKSVLTTQTISHLKEKIESFRFKLKMDSLRES